MSFFFSSESMHSVGGELCWCWIRCWKNPLSASPTSQWKQQITLCVGVKISKIFEGPEVSQWSHMIALELRISEERGLLSSSLDVSWAVLWVPDLMKPGIPGACVSWLAALDPRRVLQSCGRFFYHLLGLSSVQILWCPRKERFTL